MSNPRTFQKVNERLLDWGCFTKPFTEKCPRERAVNEEEDVLNVMTQHNGKVSVRTISAVTGVPPTTIWRILESDQLHAWYPTQVQNLTDEDFEAREMFCIWVTQNGALLPQILFSDESILGEEGISNPHNLYKWAEKNPGSVLPAHFQYRFSVNVWLGVIDEYLIGPHFFTERLTGEIYLEFLANHLPHI